MTTESSTSSHPPVHLSKGELVEITGYEKKSNQCRWLLKNKIKFRANAFGYPIVGRTYWEHLSGAPAPQTSSEPDWGALDRAVSSRSRNGRTDKAPLQ
jgi:hypothetical protein